MELRSSLNRLLIVGILIVSTAPLYAQDQQQNVDKLKVDTRNAVGVIGADKRKTRTFCQILDLRERQQEDQENNKDRNNKKKDKNRDKNKKKTEALSQKINQLQKQLGPEFDTIDYVLNHLDLQSPDGREVALIIQSLSDLCPE
jgi:DNA-directed RNA polymerase